MKVKKRLDLHDPVSSFYDRTILSEELTNTNAAEIGITTITTANITLLKNALNEGVILITNLIF